LVALAAFHVVAKHFHLVGANATVAGLRAAVDAECAAPEDVLERTYAGELQGLHYCFRGHLILGLLKELGAVETRVMFGGGEVTWSMGAALYFLAATPASTRTAMHGAAQAFVTACCILLQTLHLGAPQPLSTYLYTKKCKLIKA
jgi:hypothetical protein